MIVHQDLAAWRSARRNLESGACVGFVPTMGALHAGHASLIERSVAECDVTVLSIFVNPTQFDDPGDLSGYPKTWEADLELAERLGVDHVIAPGADDMYADDYRYQVHENQLSRCMEGAHRDGHFTGVLTVVLKLLNLVRADRAYFGEKDYQQFQLIRDMCEALFIDTEIVPCPTVREADGLALSSRNVRLACADRARAPLLARLLRSTASDAQVACRLEAAGFDVDYIETRGARRFGAVRVGSGAHAVRLIDNVSLAAADDGDAAAAAQALSA